MSQIRADTYMNRLGTKSVAANYVVEGTAKAWANLDGTDTIALRDSLNVSSVTDLGTGSYGFNYANAFAVANQSTLKSSTRPQGVITSAPTETNDSVSTGNSSGTMADSSRVVFASFGDLA